VDEFGRALNFLRLAAFFHDIGKINPQHHRDHQKRTLEYLKDFNICCDIKYSFEDSGKVCLNKVLHDEKCKRRLKDALYVKPLGLADQASSAIDKANVYLLVDTQKTIFKSSSLNLYDKIYLSEEKMNSYVSICRDFLNLLKDIKDPNRLMEKIDGEILGLCYGVRNNILSKFVKMFLEIPSETRHPLNDISLWSHAKMTMVFTDIFYTLTFFEKCSLLGVRIDLNLSDFLSSSWNVKDLKTRELIAKKIVLDIFEALNGKEIFIDDTHSFQLNIFSNIVFPDIFYYSLNPDLLSYLNSIHLSIPFHEKSFETIINDVWEAISKKLYEDDLIDIINPKIYYTISDIPKIDRDKIKNKVQDTFRGILVALFKGNLTKFNYDLGKIMSLSLSGGEGLCVICNRRVGEKHQDKIMCRRCKDFFERSRGVFMDDLGSKDDKICFLSVNLQGVEELAFGGKIKYLGYNLFLSSSRAHEIILYTTQTLEKLWNRIENNVGSIQHYILNVRMKEMFPETYIGNLIIDEMEYGVIVYKNNRIEIFGVNTDEKKKVLEDVIKKREEQTILLKSGEEINVEIKGREDVRKFPKAKLVRLTYNNLSVLLPADKLLDVEQILINFLDNRKLVYKTCETIFHKKKPLYTILRREMI